MWLLWKLSEKIKVHRDLQSLKVHKVRQNPTWQVLEKGKIFSITNGHPFPRNDKFLLNDCGME
jgi:hypothetical protein